MHGLDDAPVDIAKLTASIKAHEGLRLRVYDDSRGYATIGYGRNISTKGITQNEARYLLQGDISECLQIAQAQDWWPIVKDNDARARAITEIIFNIGLGKLNTFTQALSALRAGDFDACADEFINSLWRKQVGQRAATLAEMIRSGSD